jgi:hypothetical protein
MQVYTNDVNLLGNNIYTIKKNTNFMKLSPSWEATSCAATPELFSILWNPKVHYCVHKNPPLVYILRPNNDCPGED